MIGIIGFGRFGKLVSRYLAQDFDVWVATRDDCSTEIERIGAKPGDFKTVCEQRFVIPCVPISAFQETLHRIAPYLPQDAVVMDVCSVKTLPVRWMRETLPQEIAILPTHPMFGPDSAAKSLKGSKIVLCRERIAEGLFAEVQHYLEEKGLEVIITTPEEHDRQIAVSLSLTHYIGRTLSAFGATPLPIDTEGYKRLIHILGVVQNDTWQLFRDMNQLNPYAAEARQKFRAALDEIEKQLKVDGD